MQLENHDEALHDFFEKVREKKGDLERQLHDCERECIKSLISAKEDASRYKHRLQDEQSNLHKLATLSLARSAKRSMKWSASRYIGAGASLRLTLPALAAESKLSSMRSSGCNTSVSLTRLA